MEHRGVILTAGFKNSKYALVIAELLKRREIPIKGFIVVSPYSLKRVKKYFRQRGLSFFIEALPRLFGKTNKTSTESLLTSFLKGKQISAISIKKWAAQNSVDCISVKSLNETKTIAFLKKKSPQWLVYAGGGIIKSKIIEVVDGRILNAHQGPLPEVRGMNAAEWSLLLEKKQNVVIHLIDKGIDTGKIIKTLPYQIKKGDNIDRIRDKAKVKSIEGIVEIASKKKLSDYKLRNNNANHRQCFVLSTLMKGLLKDKLAHLSNNYSFSDITK